MIIDAIVTRATRIFKPLLKPIKKQQKPRKRSLNSFEMSSRIKPQNYLVSSKFLVSFSFKAGIY
jgi:hypothetical protein